MDVERLRCTPSVSNITSSIPAVNEGDLQTQFDSTAINQG